jgi:hypothetical protein
LSVKRVELTATAKTTVRKLNGLRNVEVGVTVEVCLNGVLNGVTVLVDQTGEGYAVVSKHVNFSMSQRVSTFRMDLLFNPPHIGSPKLCSEIERTQKWQGFEGEGFKKQLGIAVVISLSGRVWKPSVFRCLE